MDSCTCEACVSACKHDPGRFLPGEVARLAEHLGLAVEEVYHRYLIVKKLVHRGREVWVPAPAKRKAQRWVTKPGHRARDWHEAEKGTCVFLDERERCSIYPVRPYECAAYMGCRHTFQGRAYRDQDVAAYFFARWKGHQEELPQLEQA